MGGTWQAWASSFLVVAVPTVVAIGIALFLKPRQAELEASRRNHG
jgi:hypothetical protein